MIAVDLLTRKRKKSQLAKLCYVLIFLHFPRFSEYFVKASFVCTAWYTFALTDTEPVGKI